MANAPFPIRSDLTALSIAYANEEYIADQVLPRAPVSTQEFEYLTYTKAEHFTIPNTVVGRKGRVNEVEFTATRNTSQTLDYGLEFAIPQADIDNKPPNYDPEMSHTEQTTDLILLDREKRVADMVFTAGNYPSGNKATLSGTTQWSHASSDPVNAILGAMDATFYRPNIMVMGQEVWTKLRQHAKVVAAVAIGGGNASVGGIAMLNAIAQLFELDAVYVGKSRRNTANPGQSASYSRLWGKHCALLYRNSRAMPTMGVTFGLTAQWGTRVSGTWPDRNIGLRGGVRGRVGEGVRELIVASDVGYLFTDAVA